MGLEPDISVAAPCDWAWLRCERLSVSLAHSSPESSVMVDEGSEG